MIGVSGSQAMGRPESPHARLSRAASASLIDELDSVIDELDSVKVAKLQKAADEIITTYLIPDASMPLTLSAKHRKLFEKRPLPGVYQYSPDMFNDVHVAAYKDIKNDTFNRFRVTRWRRCCS